MAGSVKEFLRHKHIYVQDEWLRDRIEFAKQTNQGQFISSKQLGEILFTQWLLADLQEIGRGCLPVEISNEDIFMLQGNFCLQVNSVMDIGQPAYSQLLKLRGQDDPENLSNKQTTVGPERKARPSRMLLLQLTDGTQCVQGMEYQPIPALQATLIPGTKIEVYGEVTCRLGMLLLTANNVKVLGGEVEHLKEENSTWKVLHREIGLEIPVNYVPVISEPGTTDDQPTDAPANVPSAEPRDNNMTNTTGRNRVGTGPSNGRQEHRLKQGIISFNSAGNKQRIVQESGRPTCGNHTAAVRTHRSTNDLNPTVDGSEYFEFEAADSNFDFDQLDQLEQEGEQIAEPMDVWMDDFDAIPDDDFIFESDVVQSNLNEVNDAIGEPNKPLKMECSSEDATDSGIVGKRRSRTNPPGQSAVHNVNDLHSSSSVLKVKTEISSGPSAVGKLLQRENNFNVEAERPAIKQEASMEVAGQITKYTAPFTYLSQFPVEAKSTPSTERTIRIKAYVVTLVSHSQPTAQSQWSVTVKLNDGTDTLDADLAPRVLTDLLGFPVEEFQSQMAEVKRTRDPILCRRLQKRTEEFQKKLAAVSCFMDVHFSPTFVRPRVLCMVQPTPSDVTLLMRSIRSKMAPRE